MDPSWLLLIRGSLHCWCACRASAISTISQNSAGAKNCCILRHRNISADALHLLWYCSILIQKARVVKLLMILCALYASLSPKQAVGLCQKREDSLSVSAARGWAVNSYSRIHFQYTHFSPLQPICKVSHFSNLVGTYPGFHNAYVYHRFIWFCHRV